MTSFLLYYVSGNSERMIFNKNIISNNGQTPFLIPGHEEKCLVVLGCCGFASRMQHAYPKSSILRAFTVAKEIGLSANCRYGKESASLLAGLFFHACKFIGI